MLLKRQGTAKDLGTAMPHGFELRPVVVYERFPNRPLPK